jgi:hypothetical protein
MIKTMKETPEELSSGVFRSLVSSVAREAVNDALAPSRRRRQLAVLCRVCFRKQNWHSGSFGFVGSISALSWSTASPLGVTAASQDERIRPASWIDASRDLLDKYPL